MGVSRSTIKRWLNYLESKNALVRIPVAGKVCAYASIHMKSGRIQHI
uniref:Helix-turn-helix domain-containing protein n=1 Tax=Escherichia coli TaxID=562 RepID=A0A3G4RXE3_ECOLX|nr:helix-turn-helix domain-containing protein [Escherichia coli]